MKIFSFVLFLASINAFACPNLAGSYNCKYENETWDMSIRQTEENGVTSYHQTMGDGEGTYIADGVARPASGVVGEDIIEGTLSTTCSDSSIIIQFLADYRGSALDFTEMVNPADGVLQITDITKLGNEVVDTANYKCNLIN